MLVTFMFHLQSLRTKSLSLWVIVHNQCDFLRSSVSFTVIFCCPEVILQWQDVCRRTSVNLKCYWCWTVESEPNILANHVNFWIFRLRRHLSAKRPLPHFFHFWPEADHNFLSGACVPPQNTLSSWVLAGRFASSFPRQSFDVCPTKWTFFRDLCRWRVSNLTCFDSFHSFISVEVSLSYKLLTNSVILYTNRARTNDSPSQRAKTTWLRELHQCSYVTILGFIWQLLTFEENESFAGFIKYRNTTLLEPFENVVDF